MQESNSFKPPITKFPAYSAIKLQQALQENKGLYSHIKDINDLSFDEAFELLVRYEGLGSPGVIKSIYEGTLGRSGFPEEGVEESVILVEQDSTGEPRYRNVQVQLQSPLATGDSFIMNNSLYSVSVRVGDRWYVIKSNVSRGFVVEE